ncbi:DUF3326 domain-containing protein [bacterium]|nr:DUF3326 domain-containing protein [bacterium]
MLKTGEKLGVFIVPTGVGASIGGFAGDASCYAREFSKVAKLIVNPNVVNAGVFSGINENMLYTEGFVLDEFFKGNLNLKPSSANKIGVVFDKSIPKDVLNVHLNTIGAVKTVYGVDVIGYEITEQDVGVEFFVNEKDISTGAVLNPETIYNSVEKLLKKGAEAITIVCLFDNPEEDNLDYANGLGVDPVGGVEGIISHCVSRKFKVPCAHSPAFIDYQIYPDLVNPKSASEYITPTFLPCVLLGLNNAPQIVSSDFTSVDNVDFLVMPYNSLGSTPVFEALKRNIPIYAVRENKTLLNVKNSNLFKSNRIIEVESYKDCLKLIQEAL